jgi:hypothetical protein
VSKARRLNLDEAQEIARHATRQALVDCKARGLEIPPESHDVVTLGARLQGGDFYVFQLYAAGERPQDAQYFTEATVNRTTGEVQVKVYEDRLRSA